MAFDPHGNGMPVAWIITTSGIEVEVRKWLDALQQRMVGLKPSWRPSCFLLDDSRAEIGAIE
jgi:hypothetical protein